MLARPVANRARRPSSVDDDRIHGLDDGGGGEAAVRPIDPRWFSRGLANLEDTANRGVKVTLVIPARGPKSLRSELDVRRRLADLESRRRGITLIERPSVTPLLL